ncbi:MAG: segregation/condensation protein A [Zetaproteobacteria bacterium]|nr:MAG: segregation/condensation protein A [Zetaproteobacteria bacterium]
MAVLAPSSGFLPSIRLNNFEGPLDVLLHLIRSQKIDIFDIPISTITSQYLAILDAHEQLNLEVAGDYLVMASTLTQLKSRMLLPRPDLDEEGNEIDPRNELVSQLIAYEQYRALAEELDELPRTGRDVFTRPVFPEAAGVQRPLPEADLEALLLAFRRVLARIGGEIRHHILADTMSVREQMGVVLDRLRQGSMQLDELLRDQPGKEALVTTVLALLELWRQRLVLIMQQSLYDSIIILPNGEAHA